MIYAISLAFMPARIVRESFEAFYATCNPELPLFHVLLDQHYPVDKAENQVELEAICGEFDVAYLRAHQNLGLHRGFNFCLEELAVTASDIVIGYDPDSHPVSEGWDMALVRAIQGDPEARIVWASLMNERAYPEILKRGYDQRVVDGYIEVWEPKQPTVNSICAWRCDWLLEHGGLDQPRPYYGHLESTMWNRLGPYSWAFLTGWSETDEIRDLHDRDYVHWKACHSHLQSFDRDFEAWLESGKPIPPGVSLPDRIP